VRGPPAARSTTERGAPTIELPVRTVAGRHGGGIGTAGPEDRDEAVPAFVPWDPSGDGREPVPPEPARLPDRMRTTASEDPFALPPDLATPGTGRGPAVAIARQGVGAADRLSSSRVLLTLVRWATVLVGAVLTFSQPHTAATVVVGGILAIHALLRMVVPLSYRRPVPGVIGILGEAAVAVAAVAVTGWWGSPFVFTLVTSVVAGGVASGFAIAIPLSAAMGALVTAGALAGTTTDVPLYTEGATELFMVAAVAGYGRRIFGQAEQRTVRALSRLSQLTEANQLLQQLNLVAQTLPASLDLGETTRSTIAQIRALTKPDAIAVVLWDGALKAWNVAAAEGVRLPPVMAEPDLPRPVQLAARSALHDRSAFLVDLGSDGPGLTPAARTGIYAPLVTRQTLVGVLVLETQDPSGLSGSHLEFLTGLAEQAALAIDNALWFGRLRTVGAEEERTRIARDLHDRVAQGLAYVAFELDRIAELSTAEPVTEQLGMLRDDVRRVVTEVRDTLYDLRTDVSDAQELTATVMAFLDRVRTRSGLRVEFESRAARRLAVPLERELWRIAQEAITNVERHARARTLAVRWAVDDVAADLSVADDGCGFPQGTSGRLDSYGLLGMRERADAIGATLDIETAPGQGTVIHCRLEVT